MMADLIGKAQALRDRLSCEINRKRGQCVHEEKERLAGIRDSIGDVENMLSSLQKLGIRHRRRKEAAEARLEESRVRVMELAKLHRGSRALPILTDMEASFGQRLSKTSDVRKDYCVKTRKLDTKFFVGWIIRVVRVRILGPVVKLKRSIWVATKLTVLSLSISVFVVARRRLGARGDSSGCVVTDHALNVFHGRG